MRLLSFLTMFLMTALLAACGGGGGSPGLSSGPISTFAVLAPPAVTLQVGATSQYAVQGGVKPYTVFSSDPAVAVGWVGGDDVLVIGTLVAGSATVTTQDSKGSKFAIVVTAGSATAFYTTAPTAFTIAPGPLAGQTYTVGGGVPPYSVTTNFPDVAKAVLIGNKLTITGVQVSGTPATITLRDAAGVTLTSAVTVGTVPLSVFPTTFTVYIGDIFRAIIRGGTPPYRTQVAIDESILAVKIVNGNELEGVGGQIATNAGVTIIDANNQTVSVGVTITNGQDVLRVSPNLLTIPEDVNTPDLTLMVYGASAAGSVQVFTTDATVLKPGAPVKNADGTGYAVKLAGGNTCSAIVLAAVVGVDNTVPKNGTFTDVKGVPNLTIQPADDIAPSPASGGDRKVIITVIDAKGKIGTSEITIKDSNGRPGC